MSVSTIRSKKMHTKLWSDCLKGREQAGVRVILKRIGCEIEA
jgi:hypothetical protein